MPRGCTGVCWLDSHLATQDRPPPQDGRPHSKRSSRHVHLEAGVAVRTWTPLGRRPCAVPTSLSPNIRRDMETPQRPPESTLALHGVTIGSETMHQASVRPHQGPKGWGHHREAWEDPQHRSGTPGSWPAIAPVSRKALRPPRTVPRGRRAARLPPLPTPPQGDPPRSAARPIPQG